MSKWSRCIRDIEREATTWPGHTAESAGSIERMDCARVFDSYCRKPYDRQHADALCRLAWRLWHHKNMDGLERPRHHIFA
jgi:hypothetical protein